MTETSNGNKIINSLLQNIWIIICILVLVFGLAKPLGTYQEKTLNNEQDIATVCERQTKLEDKYEKDITTIKEALGRIEENVKTLKEKK